jgi:hypothetical protein
MPGLLQTEGYARALLSARVGTLAADVDQQVPARLERQMILDRDKPPLLWVLLDEASSAARSAVARSCAIKPST